MTAAAPAGPSAPGDRFLALDAWRGLCALVVALEHLGIDHPAHANAFVHRGYRFVDFFFVLSGFVIAHAYRARLAAGWPEVRAFLVRRVGRLWPLHVVVLAGFVAFQVVAHLAHAGPSSLTARNNLASLPANLALVQAWGWVDHPTWNIPAWSVSTELFAYALFAALCAAAPRAVDAAAVLVLAAAAAALVWLAPAGMKSTYDYGLARCLFGFMTGALVRRLHGARPLRAGTLGELAAVAAVVAGVIYLPDGAPALLVTPLFAAAVWVFAAEDGAVARALRGRVPQALGAWSYSIYLVHALLALGLLTVAMLATQRGLPLFGRVDGVASIVGGPLVTSAIVAGYLALVLGASWLTYHQVERRGQRWFARWARR